MTKIRKVFLLAALIIAAATMSTTWYLARKAPSAQQLTGRKIISDLEKAERANLESTSKRQDLASTVASLVSKGSAAVPQTKMMTSSNGSVATFPILPVPQGPPPPPTFTVQPSASVYNLGEPVVLTLTLTPPYIAAAWTVCTFAPGSVTVAYVKRDGATVVPSHTVADFPEDPLILQHMFLAELPWGTSINIPFPFGMAGNGAALLYDTSIRGAYSRVAVDPVTFQQKVINVPAYDTKVYTFDQPGLYAVRLRYQYTGFLFPGYNIFTDRIDSNEVVFSIQ